MWTRLLPFLAWLPGLRRGTLRREAWVGLNGAILALPQSMAYALIAGLPAEYGLYAAMLPVAIACLWGSSRYLVSGPTAAISVLLFSSVAPGAAGQPAIRPGRAAADLSRRRLPVAARRPARRVAGQFRLAFGDARLHPWRGAADRPRPTALSSAWPRAGRAQRRETAGGCWRGSPSSMAHRCWWAASASRSACWSGACDRAGRPCCLACWAVPRWSGRYRDLRLGSPCAGLIECTAGLESAGLRFPIDPRPVTCGGGLRHARAGHQPVDRPRPGRAPGRRVRCQPGGPRPGPVEPARALAVGEPVGGFLHPLRAQSGSRCALPAGGCVFGALGGFAGRARCAPDRACTVAGDGRRHPADRLGPDRPPGAPRALPQRPRRMPGGRPNRLGHAAVATAERHLRGSAGVAVLLPAAHLDTTRTAPAQRRGRSATHRRLDLLRRLRLPATPHAPM